MKYDIGRVPPVKKNGANQNRGSRDTASRGMYYGSSTVRAASTACTPESVLQISTFGVSGSMMLFFFFFLFSDASRSIPTTGYLALALLGIIVKPLAVLAAEAACFS